MSQRRLAAIMFTDIVGYSALSQRNESAALALVQTQQDLLRPLIASHNGEEIKSTGDGLLLEFASALQSVECAVQMQQAVRARNRDNARAVPLELRIGIHLGDVEHRDGDVFGDGVNIAARIEPLAAPGSIYISEDVARQVDGKLNVALHSHGPQALKNIRRPVEVFEVIADTSGAPTSSGSGETPNSIAVLPFADMSAAGDNEYFADGMTEELIDTFARIPDLKVIARTSVFALKGKDLDIRQIGDKLGVETVLEGSVRRAGDRLRITAQLIKVSDQSHLWSQRYDRDMGDVFAIQEDIARAIADALTARFGASAAQSLSVAVCCDPEAYSLFLQGRYFTNQRTQESLEKAKACFQQALEISPDYAGAEAGLALAALWQGSYYGDLEKNMTIASIAARRAVELDPNLAEAHSAMGEFLLLREFDWGGAEAEFRRALAINSADTEAQEGLSTVLAVSERTDEAIAQIEEFLSSNPLSLVIRRRLGVAHYVARDYASAEAVFRQLLEISPDLALTQSWLGQSLLGLGKPEEA
ncbi:MAG: tetratricopeptide repeat protein, partial [Gammaproteobacteria bacterium]|nr:tetratricopeptide repeat protein [Gammaproteobacteria bacterium]